MVRWTLTKQPRYSVIGLDIGSTMVRAVQLHRQGCRLRVHRALGLPVPAPSAPAPNKTPVVADAVSVMTTPSAPNAAPVMVENQTKALDPAVLSVLQELREKGGFRGNAAVLHCPAEHIDVRPVTLPATEGGLPRDAVLGALRLQVGNNLKMPLEQAVFDYFMIEDRSADGSITVMSTVADSTWVDTRVRAVNQAGFRCVGVDALPCALARLTQSASAVSDADDESKAQSRKAMQAVLEIGHQGSFLTVLRGDMPVFCRSFSLGGERLTELVAERLRLDTNRAERLKQLFGIHYHSAEKVVFAEESAAWRSVAAGNADRSDIGQIVFDAIQDELSDYLVGLTRSLNYAINEYRGTNLEQIVLCGACAHMKNLPDYFAESFGIPVRLIEHDVLAEIAAGLPATRAQLGDWATAVGLALGGIGR